jgi:phosphoglucomutase
VAEINPRAGKTADPSMLANVPRLVTSYFAGKPDPSIPAQRVARTRACSTSPEMKRRC